MKGNAVGGWWSLTGNVGGGAADNEAEDEVDVMGGENGANVGEKLEGSQETGEDDVEDEGITTE